MIDFERTFGGNNQNNGAQGASRKDQPKANIWLNVGYTAKGVNDDGTDRFVSLPVGIPVDTMEHLATTARNRDYAEFNAARNGILDQIMAVAKTLAPGGEAILNLEIQLRRVNEELEPISSTEGNRFAANLDLVAAPVAAAPAAKTTGKVAADA